MRRAGKLVAVLTMLTLLLTGVAKAEDITVTIGVGDTILRVEGQTSPDAFVTISKDDAVIGTATADAAGEFQQTFPAQDPGTHKIAIFAHTTGGHNTDVIATNVNITEHGTTTVNLFLPSTLQMDQPDLAQGEPLHLEGEAAPSSTISIYIDNANFAAAQTDAQGNWQAAISVASLSPGRHEFFVRVTDGFGAQSYPTTARYFTIAQPPVSIPPVTRPHTPAITFPQSGTTWHDPAITIRGTAGPGSQVELWDGSTIIGSAWSNSHGEWSLFLQLEQRSYELRARACVQQVCSVFSPTIRFTYTPQRAGERSPLRVVVPRSAFLIYENKPVTLRATVLDGESPYKITIKWGDGKTETRTSTSNNLSLTHVFSKQGKYSVEVNIQDARGREKTVFYTVDVQPEGAPVLANMGWIILLLLTLIVLLVILLLLGHRRRNKEQRH